MSNHKHAAALPVVVLISGSGSNLQAIIDAVQHDDLPVEIRAVISSRPDAYGLERARAANIPAEVVDHKAFNNRAEYEAELQASIDQHEPALVVLAGYMRILGTAFVAHYQGRMLNIHPSLLPAFPGLNTHQRALDANVAKHGASIHFVTNELDGGPVILQGSVPLLPNDDAQSLAKRVYSQEHQIYPLAIRWFAEGRLTANAGNVRFDQKPLTHPIQYSDTR
ncbi:Phosphoribosylglycinamide formyltransferase [hydrothermal vent metagenome]|uniref:phosphoribosylglycinamide formyltransferase 1 n=1 Tax=hydrothermal vent metagenome TaxID=652676 RepID=A0A3B0Z525_9ZZZZ